MGDEEMDGGGLVLQWGRGEEWRGSELQWCMEMGDAGDVGKI